MYDESDEPVITRIEHRSSFQILSRLYDFGGSSPTLALLESIASGQTSFYSALRKLEKSGLINHHEKSRAYRNPEKKVSLTELGKKIAYEIKDIERMLIENQSSSSQKDKNK